MKKLYEYACHDCKVTWEREYTFGKCANKTNALSVANYVNKIGGVDPHLLFILREQGGHRLRDIIEAVALMK